MGSIFLHAGIAILPLTCRSPYFLYRSLLQYPQSLARAYMGSLTTDSESIITQIRVPVRATTAPLVSHAKSYCVVQQSFINAIHHVLGQPYPKIDLADVSFRLYIILTIPQDILTSRPSHWRRDWVRNESGLCWWSGFSQPAVLLDNLCACD